MYVVELTFECFEDTTLSRAEQALLGYLDALRYNGQILGRELPTSLQDGCFKSRVVCPEPESLHPRHHSQQVEVAEQRLHQAGLLAPKVQLEGPDLFSDSTDPCPQPSWQVLYTSYLHTCSPLRCGEHFAPIPLYRIPPVANGDHKQVIKWQEDWEACDQLQMNGSIAEHAALHELGDVDSRLFRRGWDLCKRIQYLTKVPTYYYLYRVGGHRDEELSRPCPQCGQPWRLAEPLHDIFDFKCDTCQLVSNISWDFKE